MDDRPDKNLGGATADVVGGRDGRPRGGQRPRERRHFQPAEAEHADSDTAERTANIVRARERGDPPVRRIEQRLTVVPPRRDLATDQYRGQYVLPPTPKRKPPYGEIISFVICVIVPVIVASIYYFLIASNQYVAEFRFTVKEALSPSTSTQSASLLGMLNMMGGLQDNYIVTDFLGSREAVDELEKRIQVAKLYSKPEIDWWARFNSSQPVEKFIPYWQDMLTARFDQVTGIASVQVRAFSAQDALLIANTLVTMSEELINRIANRTATDSVRFAQNEVKKAEERLKTVRGQLTEFRNRTGVIDPATSLAASNSALTQSLRANLAQLETQLSTLQRQNLQMNTPVMVSLQNQIKATKEQLQNIEATVAQSRDGVALSTVMAEFEQLDLERQFAQAAVTATMQALDVARANAASQHLYITPYVRPGLPESSIYPKPVRAVLVVAILAFVVWICLLLLTRSIRERFV